MFNYEQFKSHSGLTLDWKIDCDTLSYDDLECLAKLISKRFSFGKVVSVPTGGDKLAQHLNKYIDVNSSGVIVVDDVLTTGGSLRPYLEDDRQDIFGVVIFSRINKYQRHIINLRNVYPIFELSNEFGDLK